MRRSISNRICAGLLALGLAGIFGGAYTNVITAKAKAGAAANAEPVAAAPRRVKVLFLGDHGHHEPLLRLRQLYSPMGIRGIDFTYTDRMTDLNPETLSRYDVLFLYGNIAPTGGKNPKPSITPEQEKALIDFVESGHGFTPIHCASACFNDSEKIVAMMGARFKAHKTGVFKESVVLPDHPIEKGLKTIENWDETYVHDKFNEEGRTILAYREEDGKKEPWTWVRNQGKGRVFYTAWGHDERTWANPDFQNLIERGIRWAAGDWALTEQASLKAFEYTEGKLPNYLGGPGALITKMQKPIADVNESMKHMAMAPGFEPKFFAGEPKIVKPICMAFDEKGRLWVAETVDYPNDLQEPGKGNDRITICEDTTGAGVADKFTVFADKLSIPTSMVFANGGVIVSQAPDMLFLKDSSGNGKATERKILFSGWGTRDTHAGPSNLHWGMDGWIYGTVGYSGFKGEVGGKQLSFGAGVFRFKPDGSALEFMGSTNNNTWGLGISEDFEVFASTANHNPSFYLGVANRYFETVLGWAARRPATIWDDWHFFPISDKVRQVDQHAGYTAGAGSELYTARTYPQWYWNHVKFVTEPTGHLVGQFALEPSGSGYYAINQFSLFASNDEWTAPIAAAVGPDGHVWMIDWYNIIVQHNPTPKGFQTGPRGAYVTEHRDHTHGRVYRLVWKDGKESPKFDLTNASTEKLLEALKSDNMLWRNHAQRLLVEGGRKDAAPALIQLINDQNVDAIGLNAPAIHSLWALHDLGLSNEPKALAAITGALKHKSPGVRKNALMVLPRTVESIALILKEQIQNDPDVQVRKNAFLALSEMPSSDAAGKAAYDALAAAGDADLSSPGKGKPRAKAPNAQAKKSLIPNGPEVAAAPNDTSLIDSQVIAGAKHDAGFLKAVFAANPLKADGAQAVEKEVAEPKIANVNLIENPSFENEKNMQPIGWHTNKYAGNDVKYEWASIGRTGKHSVKISSENGVDAGWMIDLKCDPNTDYVLSGWIKTENLKRVGRAEGALLNLHIHQLRSNSVSGTGDWKKVELKFNSGVENHVIINCLYGGYGLATGAAYYDDIELVRASPAIRALPGTVGQAVAIIANHYAQRGPTDSIVATLTSLKTADSKLAGAVIDGIALGWPRGKTLDLSAADVEQVKSVMAVLPPIAKDRMLVLAQRWGKPDLFGGDIAAIAKDINKTLSDEKAPPEKRIESARRLLAIADSHESVASIVKQLKPGNGPELQTGLINALSDSRDDSVGIELVKQWKKLTPGTQRTAAAVMIRKVPWATALLNGVEKSGINPKDIATDQWQSLQNNSDNGVQKLAKRVFSLTGGVSASRKEVVDKFIGLADKPGDLELGKKAFQENCMICHTLDGQGGKIGPELTGVGIRPKADILMQILDPNRNVEGTFRLWTAKTKDGDDISGRLMAETATTVDILDLTGVNHVMQRAELKSLSVSELGIMPEGLESVGDDKIKGILEYLATSKVKHDGK